MKYCFLLLTMCFVTFGCSQSKTKRITEFSQKSIGSGILIDVRTPEEYSQGHMEDAVNINWFDEDFAQQVDTLSKDRAIFVYCKKGGRSAKAAHVLDSLGFKNVTNLEGGYDALMAGKGD